MNPLRYILFFGLVMISISCDTHMYDLEKVDVINFSNLYTQGPSLKKSNKSGLIQRNLDSGYLLPAVTNDDILGVYNITQEGEFVSFEEIGTAQSCSKMLRVDNFYYLLSNENNYAKVYRLDLSLNIVDELSFSSLVVMTDIINITGNDLYYDEVTEDLYVAGICERNMIGEQLMMMRLEKDLTQSWPSPKKYFDLAPAYSIAAFDDNELIVTGVKEDESPYLIRMARTGNLLGNIILLDDLNLDDLNSVQIIDTSIFITGSSIDVDPQSLIAKYSIDGLNAATMVSTFGIGCNPISSTTYHQFLTNDGSIVALADDRNLNEIHITKYDPLTPALEWNQCYPNFDEAIDVQTLAGIQTIDNTFAFAAIESQDGFNYFLRIIKTDIVGDVRY